MGCLPTLPVVSPPDRGYGFAWRVCACLQSGVPKFAVDDFWQPVQVFGGGVLVSFRLSALQQAPNGHFLIHTSWA